METGRGDRGESAGARREGEGQVLIAREQGGSRQEGSYGDGMASRETTTQNRVSPYKSSSTSPQRTTDKRKARVGLRVRQLHCFAFPHAQNTHRHTDDSHTHTVQPPHQPVPAHALESGGHGHLGEARPPQRRAHVGGLLVGLGAEAVKHVHLQEKTRRGRRRACWGVRWPDRSLCIIITTAAAPCRCSTWTILSAAAATRSTIFCSSAVSARLAFFACTAPQMGAGRDA